MTDTALRIGLRFNPADLSHLRRTTQQLRSLGAEPEIVAQFDKALAATEDREPLVVICDKERDAQLIAASFVALGCQMPAFEDLGTELIPDYVAPTPGG